MCSLVKYLKINVEKNIGPCYLKPLNTRSGNIIKLKPGLNIIGRSLQTGIEDTKCSKQQLELHVNLITRTINLRILGVNPSGVNGLMALTDAQCSIQHGDVLELVYGRHPYEVIFQSTQLEDNPSRYIGDNASKTKLWHCHEGGKLWWYNSDSSNIISSTKIAGYDLDGTLIRTKSGNVFPKDNDDWLINYDCILKKLRDEHSQGYKICVFTNQAGISKGKTSLEGFKKKIEAIVQLLKVPLQVFVATGDGYHRKPLPGMWEYLEKETNNGLQINKKQSFYVGDAAGRDFGNGKEHPSSSNAKKRRKDHSLVDRLFALNIGIKFYTPEEHFLLKNTENWIKPAFVPANYFYKDEPLLEPKNTILNGNQCEVIIMIGLPGSGKSHFCQMHLQPLGYKVINSDTLNGINACLVACEKNLSKDIACVIDNTNVDLQSRKKFINLAKKYAVPCRCFMMALNEEHIRHNIIFRNLTDRKHSKINEMILNTIKKRYVTPTLDEGFKEIVRVNFKPRFNSKHLENLYKLYLNEK